MSLQRTPPTHYSSDPDLQIQEKTDYVNIRKRKQIDYEDILASIDSKFDLHMKILNEKIFKNINQCVSEAVTTTISQQLSSITSSLENLNINMQKISADNITIHKSLSELHQRVSDTEKSLEFSLDTKQDFEKRLKNIESNVSSVSSSQDRIVDLENKISVMEQQARICNIEVCNLQERRGENLLQIIEQIAKEIKHPIQHSDIVAIHRVPHADSKNPKPKNIIVKFTTRVLRDNFIASYRTAGGLNSTQLSLSGTPHVIYINEHLTLKNKQLFRQCRDAAKKYEYKYVWVKHGTILARKTDTSPVVAIRSHYEINKIK